MLITFYFLTFNTRQCHRNWDFINYKPQLKQENNINVLFTFYTHHYENIDICVQSGRGQHRPKCVLTLMALYVDLNLLSIQNALTFLFCAFISHNHSQKKKEKH